MLQSWAGRTRNLRASSMAELCAFVAEMDAALAALCDEQAVIRKWQQVGRGRGGVPGLEVGVGGRLVVLCAEPAVMCKLHGMVAASGSGCVWGGPVGSQRGGPGADVVCDEQADIHRWQQVGRAGSVPEWRWQQVGQGVW